MNKKHILNVGLHIVEISKKPYNGITENKIPYFDFTFENSQGYIPQRFYDNESGKKFMDKLFAAAGLIENIVDTKDLISKILVIKIIDDPKNEKFPKRVVDFFKTINPLNI